MWIGGNEGDNKQRILFDRLEKVRTAIFENDKLIAVKWYSYPIGPAIYVTKETLPLVEEYSYHGAYKVISRKALEAVFFGRIPMEDRK